ncbi:hypothetical protein B0H17DRAFT_1161758 [Mycena rosella]|uniref:Uncharacterized protein n=1 Tax=Mycena rosella TaxID=1033263 RepID=A0AAD7D1Z8_MYCRO|nr:hypothetical protein B0H17DRAFT_1161758 [Mycena rosella]
MKFSTPFALLASLITFLPSAHALVGSSWSVTNVPSGGLADITFSVTIQFNFAGLSDVGYTGIQPRPGRGVSCAVEWNGVYGRTYDYERARAQIGSFTLPAGSDEIQSSQAGFVEWYPWNGGEPPNHCARLPYQKTIFGNPRTTHTGSVGTQSLSYEYGDCIGQVAFHTENAAGGVENNCGFEGASELLENSDYFEM